MAPPCVAGSTVQAAFSPAYAPPEVLMAYNAGAPVTADASQDMWSLGVYRQLRHGGSVLL